MEQLINSAATILLGGAMTALGYMIRALTERDTHVSNRVFEMRLQALQVIWDRVNDLIYVVSPSAGMGHEMWYEVHYTDAEALLIEFKKEVERQQIVLDVSVINAFRDLFSVFQLFMVGELKDQHGKSISYLRFVEERMKPKM